MTGLLCYCGVMRKQADQSGFSLMSVLLAWVLCSSCALVVYRISRRSAVLVMAAHYHNIAVTLLPMAAQLHFRSPRGALYQQWLRDVREQLPHGEGQLACSARRCDVQLHWQFMQPAALQGHYGV